MSTSAYHGSVRLCDLEGLLDDLAVLVGAIHLAAEHLGVDLDLFTRPPYEA